MAAWVVAEGAWLKYRKELLLLKGGGQGCEAESEPMNPAERGLAEPNLMEHCMMHMWLSHFKTQTEQL